jgi:hypothetical protein
MKRREDNHLLQALESAVAECRRLEGRIQELEEELRVIDENVLYDEEKKRYDNRPKRQRRTNRTYRPWQKKEETEPQPMPRIETTNRRNVNDIVREVKQKHEDSIAKQRAKKIAEQIDLQEDLAEAASQNKKPVDVQLSESKQRLLIEAGRTVMDKAGK